MDGYDQFAQWAAAFINSCRGGSTAAGTTPIASGIQYVGVTAAACQLLQAVDGGGVPAFVTNRLRRIAEENGIEVRTEWTPNDIIAAIRAKSSVFEPQISAPE